MSLFAGRDFFFSSPSLPAPVRLVLKPWAHIPFLCHVFQQHLTCIRLNRRPEFSTLLQGFAGSQTALPIFSKLCLCPAPLSPIGYHTRSHQAYITSLSLFHSPGPPSRPFFQNFQSLLLDVPSTLRGGICSGRLNAFLWRCLHLQYIQ